MRIRAPIPQQGGPRTPKNQIFLKNIKNHPKGKNSKVQKYAKISNMPFDQGSLIHREAWFPPCFVRQNDPKKNLSFFRYQTTFKQKCSNPRPLLPTTLPQGLCIYKNIRHLTSGSGGKKTFKRYPKSEQTHGQTDGQTDKSTYRKHRPRGPML